ncbi:hypothetical protein Q8A67_003285 [Cirrhinus molitorella]|uniref:Uncharacterized protein n=1 Tax=Cirrhinus molitorella TaxID=172907 RepID=A0AA88Q8Z4_9TELE|nr:hypothetical protein Q8A67_003285 [Cirrhinus molitorella]
MTFSGRRSSRLGTVRESGTGRAGWMASTRSGCARSPPPTLANPVRSRPFTPFKKRCRLCNPIACVRQRKAKNALGVSRRWRFLATFLFKSWVLIAASDKVLLFASSTSWRERKVLQVYIQVKINNILMIS